MNLLPRPKQESVIHLLLEGCSIRSAERLTGVHRDTIMRLMVRAGRHCERLMNAHIRNLRLSVIEVDEAWSYVGKKDAQMSPGERSDPEVGSQWIFVAMCRESKLIPAFALGKRTTEVAEELMVKLRRCLRGRPRMVTDAFQPYLQAVDRTFGSEVDYTMMTKEFRDGTARVRSLPIQGKLPDEEVSTSGIERQNLTLRNFVRRLARKTICFSKKRENLRAALALHFCWYDFGRVHGTLKCTPAMEAGVAGSVWEVEKLLPE